MQTNYQPSNKNGRSRFRKTPWFCFREEGIKSSWDALILSTLWSSHKIPGTGEHKTSSQVLVQEQNKKKSLSIKNPYCQISNQEISKRSGIKGGAQAVKYHLAKLEKLGLIKRHGYHKNRIIELLFGNRENDDGLIISEEILNSNLSPTQKLLRAISEAFPKAKKDWICQQINISCWTYYNKIELAKKTNLNQLKKQSELVKKTNSLIEGREGYSVLGRESFSYEKLEVIPPSINLEDNKMQSMLQSINKHPHPKNNNSDILMELQHEVFSHKYITKNKENRTIKRSMKVIKALSSPGGLSNILENSQIMQIIHVMSNNKIYPLTPYQVKEILYKQFTVEERVELYQRISMNRDKVYGGPGSRIPLYEAAYDCKINPGWSDVVWVWLRHPKFKQKPTPIIPEKLKPVVALLEKEFPKENKINIIKLVKELKIYHEKTVLPYTQKHGATIFLQLSSWLSEAIVFSTKRNEGLEPRTGWLKPGAKTFDDWEKEWRTRVIDNANLLSRTNLIKQSIAKEEEKTEITGYMDAYGREAAIEVYGKETIFEVEKRMDWN